MHLQSILCTLYVISLSSFKEIVVQLPFWIIFAFHIFSYIPEILVYFALGTLLHVQQNGIPNDSVNGSFPPKNTVISAVILCRLSMMKYLSFSMGENNFSALYIQNIGTIMSKIFFSRIYSRTENRPPTVRRLFAKSHCL